MKQMVAGILCAFAAAGLIGCAEQPKPRITGSIKQNAATRELSEKERSQQSIAERCGQRHVDHTNGILESDEDREQRNKICAQFLQGGG
jgi:hypothetical protein